MFEELDTIVLNRDLEKNGLKKGDIGTIVHVYEEGKTVAVLTLTPSNIRPMERNGRWILPQSLSWLFYLKSE